MKPYPFTSNRLDIDKYLEDHKDAPRSTAFPGLEVEPPFTFRAWAIRLNDRIERWLDRTDWPRVDIFLGNVGAFVVTGIILWFAYVAVDAFLQGRFNLGAN